MSEVPPLRIRVLTSIDQVSQFWEWLTAPGRRMVAADTETTGLNWWDPAFKVRLIQFGDVNGGWAIPFQGWRALVEGTLEWCSKHRVTVVWHNSGYDALALRSAGIEIDWSIMEDTFIWAGVAGYAEHNRQLKVQAMREFGPWAGAGERVLKTGMSNAGWSWADVPMGWKPYPLYGVVDTCVTAALWELWDAQGRRKRWAQDHALEMASIRITNEMSWRGLPVDGSYLFEQIEDHRDREDQVRTRLAHLGITNPHQGGQLELLLINDGIKLPDKTDKGKVKLDAEVLQQIDHQAARDVLEFRGLYKVRTSYLEAMLNAAGGDLPNGVIPGPGAVIHPGIKPFEARTGRMSVENPPLQQLPADDPTVRRGVVARNEGDVVVSADFGQIELRMWASITKDTAMIAALKTADATGEDFFVELGKVVYGESDFQKKDHRRRLLKATTYTKLFGGGIETAAAQAGVNVYSLVPTWKSLENNYPSLKTLGAELIKTRKSEIDGQPEHVVTSPFGREFKVRDPIERRKLGNYVCQGSAAIALKKALVGLDAAGFGPYMMLPVHDEVLSSFPEHEAKDAMIEIAEVMDSIVNESTGWLVDVTAEPGMGANWAEAH